ncbi:MAG: DEAD/DEAH box helicase family protein [Spirochaetaceae bacterium]|jgi:superfamily II DNA or RNA helicase|nr:DEAD/DEAH box helicase family protein [Spirochaetaceae bacterium]
MARQTYGRTPWGKWFIEVLDSYQMGARLDRGRSYANTGKVLSLDIREGKAVAKVKGHYRPSYRVEIAFPRLEDEERLFELIREDPALLARIAAGELPESFLTKLKREGINLIPRRWEEMKRSCTCPDVGDPCKHMAALYYIIAREIDADPQVLFRLRGIDLREVAGPYGASLKADGGKALAAPFTVPADKSPRELPQDPPDFPEIPHCTDLILSLLPPSPAFCEKDFSLELAEFYHRAARFVPWEDAGAGEAEGEESDPDPGSVEHRFSRSHWSLDCAAPKPGAQPVLVRRTLSGDLERSSLYDAFIQFRSFSSEDGTGSYTFLYYLFKFLNLLCAAGAIIPWPLREGKQLRIIWLPYDQLPPIRSCLDALARYEDRLLPLGAKPPSGAPAAGGTAAASKKKPVYAGGRGVVDLIASAFLTEWVKRLYFAQGKGQAADRHVRELLYLFFQGDALDVASPALRSMPLAIANWLAVLRTDFSAFTYQFTLKAAAEKRKAPSKAGGAPEFSLSMEVLLPGSGEGEIEKVPLKDAVKKTGSLDVLRAPTALSNYLPELRSLTDRKTVALGEERLADFLDNASVLLTRLGIPVIFPKNLHRELKPRLVLRGEVKQAGALVSYLGLEKLLNWQWQVAIGDEVLSAAEFEALVKQKQAVVKFRDKFIRLEPAELARLLKEAQTREPTVNDFLKAHFAGDSLLSFDASEIISHLFGERSFPVPGSLRADLREYQTRGYNWICSLLFSGFGCILADDMGLGKTIQSITVLLHLKDAGLLGDGCLIVAPAALLENWERELGRFAPSLTVSRYHGSGRRLDGAEVFLTTYQTAVRDSEKLTERPFSILIADEAHLMKNAETRGSRTLKQLRSAYRLALSGTPVENRLEDMRSLFDFILPGYLGTQAEFKEAFRTPIEVLRQKDKAEALRRITAPFLLRRLKTDKTVIADLPDKVSINEYAVLEKGQAALYESIVAETLEKSEKLEDPRDRRALVLGLLTSLKQVCDHPRVYDKESPPLSSLSGKTRLLLTLLQEILANREKVLIFSQYVETLACLEAIIREELAEAALVYHGGLSQKTRSAVIDAFQTESSSRILLVSLRAGGLGLNLTAASRVIHYDLWYNPAVENQATDRAFRIGQKRTVFVHRFITRNSFEERIDAMLTSKRELADMTVSSGESWLARMSHEELKALFDR